MDIGILKENIIPINESMTTYSLETTIVNFEDRDNSSQIGTRVSRILDIKLYFDVLLRSTPVLLIFVQGSILQLYAFYLLRSYNSLYITTAFGLFNSFRMLTFELIHGCIDENTDIMFSRAFSSLDTDKSKDVIFCALISLAVMMLGVIAPLVLSAEHILVLIGFNKQTSRLTYEMLIYSIPSMLLQCIDKLFMSLGYSQSIATPYIFSQVAVTAINIALLYLEVGVLNLGLRGIVNAKLLSDIFPVLFNILIFFKYGDHSYFGFPKEFGGIKDKIIRFMKDSLDFAIAEYCETIGLKIPIILVSWTKDIKILSAYVAAENLGNFSIMSSISLGTSYNIKLNRLLGQGNFKEAIIEFFRTCTFTFSLGCIIIGGVLYLNEPLVQLYSSEASVQKYLGSLVIVIALMIPIDLIFETVTSTIRSLGFSKLLSLLSVVLLILINSSIGYFVGIRSEIGVASFISVYATLMYIEAAILFTFLTVKNWEECQLDISFEEEDEVKEIESSETNENDESDIENRFKGNDKNES